MLLEALDAAAGPQASPRADLNPSVPHHPTTPPGLVPDLWSPSEAQSWAGLLLDAFRGYLQWEAELEARCHSLPPQANVAAALATRADLVPTSSAPAASPGGSATVVAGRGPRASELKRLNAVCLLTRTLASRLIRHAVACIEVVKEEAGASGGGGSKRGSLPEVSIHFWASLTSVACQMSGLAARHVAHLIHLRSGACVSSSAAVDPASTSMGCPSHVVQSHVVVSHPHLGLPPPSSPAPPSLTPIASSLAGTSQSQTPSSPQTQVG